MSNPYDILKDYRTLLWKAIEECKRTVDPKEYVSLAFADITINDDMVCVAWPKVKRGVLVRQRCFFPVEALFE